MNYEIDPVCGCHLYVGQLDRDGYGVERSGKRAHRAAWERARGPIPPGMELDHVCRVRRCVRPEHLETVTQRENKRRMQWKVRAQQERCPKGHDLFTHGRRTQWAGIVCLICAPL